MVVFFCPSGLPALLDTFPWAGMDCVWPGLGLCVEMGSAVLLCTSEVCLFALWLFELVWFLVGVKLVVGGPEPVGFVDVRLWVWRALVGPVFFWVLFSFDALSSLFFLSFLGHCVFWSCVVAPFPLPFLFFLDLFFCGVYFNLVLYCGESFGACILCFLLLGGPLPPCVLLCRTLSFWLDVSSLCLCPGMLPLRELS